MRLKNSLILLREYVAEHWLFLALFAALGVLLYCFASIDIWVANLFFDGENFYNNLFGKIVYHGAYYLTLAVIIGLFAMLILHLTTKINPFGLPKKAIIFYIVVVIMAPGIVANTILKDNFGRPRPAHIVEFGGDSTFQAPFVISNQCDKNCSFVSGHAAFAFTFMALGLLFSGRARFAVCASGFLFGVIVGFVRIFQGRHFFSDVVFAFFFTWLTITLIYKFFYPNDELPKTIKK